MILSFLTTSESLKQPLRNSFDICMTSSLKKKKKKKSTISRYFASTKAGSYLRVKKKNEI